MEQIKVNTERLGTYVALEFATGLTDLTLVVRKPDGSIYSFNSGEGVFTEQGEGIYKVSYTPNVVGIWQEKITSTSNSDKIINTIKVVHKNVGDVSNELSTVDGKVDGIDTKITTVDGKVNTIDGKIDGVDTKVTSVDTKITTIDGKVDTLDTKIDGISGEIKPGGYLA